MKFTDYPQGTPCWVDLSSPDLDATKTFYSELFGWNPLSSDDPQFGGYAMFHVGADAVAGAGPQMGPDQPVAWVTYLAADDADATVAAVQANGGSVLAPPFDVGDQGRMAICADPTGAVFGIWQKLDFAGAALANEPGSLCWNELVSTDLPAAAAFYEAVFGLLGKPSDMGGIPYTLLQLGEKSVGGAMSLGDDFPAGTPSHWAVYFAVEDADETAAKVEKLGGTVLAPAQDAEGIGRWVPVRDPQGAQFFVMKM